MYREDQAAKVQVQALRPHVAPEEAGEVAAVRPMPVAILGESENRGNSFNGDYPLDTR